MKTFGWFLFLVGAAILVWAGFIGVDTGHPNMRVANLGGLGLGIGTMISGAIFAGIGELTGRLIVAEPTKVVNAPMNDVNSNELPASHNSFEEEEEG